MSANESPTPARAAESGDGQQTGYVEEWEDGAAAEKIGNCAICLGLPRLAVAHECGQLFCEFCWQEWANSSDRRCPICRELGDVHPAHRDRRTILSLVVLCPLKCGGKMALRDKTAHVQSACPNRLVACQHCGEQQPASGLDRHESSECSQRPVERCPLCSAELVAPLAEHLASSLAEHLALATVQLQASRHDAAVMQEELEVLRIAARAAYPLHCPAGAHPLAIATGRARVCDVCQKPIAATASAWHCAACDFDVCFPCRRATYLPTTATQSSPACSSSSTSALPPPASATDARASRVQFPALSWSPTLSNMTRVSISGQTASSHADTCNSDVIVVAQAAWTRGLYYWEVVFSKWMCLSRVGVVSGELDASKFGGGYDWSPRNPPLLGALDNTWSFGSGPGYNSPNFLPVGWPGDGAKLSVGLLLDLDQMHLWIHFAGNWQLAHRKLVGTGPWRPAVQLCHRGHQVTLVQPAALPSAALPT